MIHIPRQEVPQVDELAVSLVLDVDDTPAVLAAPHSLSVDDHIAFRPNDRKRDHILHSYV